MISAAYTVDDVSQYFIDAVERIAEILQLNKEALITTPNIELHEIKKNFEKFIIPTEPQSYASYQQNLLKSILPYLVDTNSPRFIGHMTSILPAYTAEISQLISMLNQNMVKIETSKVFTFLEREAIAILHRSFYAQESRFYLEHSQNQKSNLGIVTTSGSIANISALWVARNFNFPAQGDFHGVAEEGWHTSLRYYGYDESIILVSPLLHYSFEKAASLLGIGKKCIHHMPISNDNSIDTEALRQQIIYLRQANKHILAIIGIAGATETGGIDPLDKLADIAAEFSIYYHVDAAFGGPLIFVDSYKHLLNGIHRADSITICGHKQLYIPLGLSLCLFRDPQKLHNITNLADYQATSDSFDFGKISAEGSRAANSLHLHANLHLIAKQGYEQIMTKNIHNAQYLQNCILASDTFELVIEPQINIVNYRYIPEIFRKKLRQGKLSSEDNRTINKVNALLQSQQFKEGRSFISKTYIPVKKYDTEILTLRAVLCNPLTSTTDVDFVLQNQLEIANVIMDKQYQGSIIV